jgi:hypothetical protein
MENGRTEEWKDKEIQKYSGWEDRGMEGYRNGRTEERTVLRNGKIGLEKYRGICERNNR